jgi:hypothetical protein
VFCWQVEEGRVGGRHYEMAQLLVVLLLGISLQNGHLMTKLKTYVLHESLLSGQAALFSFQLLPLIEFCRTLFVKLKHGLAISPGK